MGLGVLLASRLRDSQVLCSEMPAIVDRGSVERESVYLSSVYKLPCLLHRRCQTASHFRGRE